MHRMIVQKKKKFRKVIHFRKDVCFLVDILQTKIRKPSKPKEQDYVTRAQFVDLRERFTKYDTNRLSTLIPNKLMFHEYRCRIFTTVQFMINAIHTESPVCGPLNKNHITEIDMLTLNALNFLLFSNKPLIVIMLLGRTIF
jgi:hypothetical protein